MFKVYLSLDGSEFDARRFHKAVGQGDLALRKRIKDGRVISSEYWRSQAQNVPAESVSGYVCMLLERFRAALAQDRGATPTLHVVGYFSSLDDVCGLSLNPAAMEALSRSGVQFDFDISRKSERVAARDREYQDA